MTLKGIELSHFSKFFSQLGILRSDIQRKQQIDYKYHVATW